MGYSERAQRPQAPQKHLEGSGGAHTDTHRKGGVGKAKCHLSATPERAARGFCWEDQGSGMQHKTGRGSWGTATSASMPRGFLGTPRAGLWPWGSGFHKQRNPDVSQGTSSSLCPTAGHPTLWKLFPWCQRAELQGPASDHSSSFLPRSVLPPCLWQFCSGVGGGILPSVWFFQSAPAKAACALCQLPSCGGTGSI